MDEVKKNAKPEIKLNFKKLKWNKIFVLLYQIEFKIKTNKKRNNKNK